MSGLWHGASWNFVIWGAYHGFFLVLEKSFLLKLYERVGKIIKVILNFFVVVTGWVFFRIETFGDAVSFIKSMFSFHLVSFPELSNKFIFTFILAVLFSFFVVPSVGQKVQNYFYGNFHLSKSYVVLTVLSIVLFSICLGSITASNFNPFIYFRF
jgi:alginate O-acetyltransferase complex protein AlgI